MLKTLDNLDNFNLDLNLLITVLNDVGAYIYMKDLEGNYTYANRLVLELFNIELINLVGKNDSYFFNLELANELIENDKRVFNGEILETVEKNVIKETNEIKYYQSVKKPLLDKNGKIVGLFGISTDITSRKNLENDLKKQKKFLDLVLNNVEGCIYIKDDERRFQYVNQRVADLFGKRVDEIIGKIDSEVIPKEIADIFWESDYEVLRTNKKISVEEVFKDDERGNTYYWTTILPYKLIENKSCVIGFATDVTILKNQEIELKKKDKILYQQSKIVAMGEMIENIAHQWRQPLSVISTISSQIKLKKELNLFEKELENSEIIDAMSKIKITTEYLSETIDYFRNFLHKEEHKEYFSSNELINNLLELVNIEIKSNEINLIKRLENITIYGIKNEILQVLINLLNNAKDPLKEKNITEKYILVELFERDKDIIIQIQDNAGGIDEKIVDRIFEPYFTTKHKSSGTGIGLFLSQKIAVNHLNGEITVSNKEIEILGKKFIGACFELRFIKNSD